VADELKPVVIHQVADVVLGTSEQVVNTNDLMTFTQKTVTEVGTEKTCAASY